MAAPEIITFGCRLNACESEIIRRSAGDAGLADAVIVNTCAVTAEAERQARQAIRRARRAHPGARIIVTGCAATLAPARYAAMPEVDRVLDNEAKLRAESYAAMAASPILPRSRERERDQPPPPLAGEGRGGGLARARAYLQVQQGCDHRCTFCIIPYARGPSRSVPVATVVAQARAMVAAGTREIVLTGVDLTAYGADLPHRAARGAPSLGVAVRRLLAEVPELPRLRLSSLDPSEIDDELWAVFAEEQRLMPHLHLSLQAGDDLILKRMKRRHNRAQALATARRARALRPDAAVGADLIAGFPTEDEAMFGNTLDLVAEMNIAFLHVFPYSPRPGTAAARMPAVPPEIVRERAARLRAAGQAALAAELRSRIGAVGDVLIEKPGIGRAGFYAPVACPPAMTGIQPMRFTGVADAKLTGVPVR
ncbi:MAG TPA: tRNA (N(6)-L-threonylcarbamoyladenosine(37)-C(2))-methylthiotransferase MtaB [Stellaceae bacterium]|nr:tRNA (N(6)-L-threonylcarbamoyladenosine(37)-C(2))-methylthiotransferase MtaB [Stellaceae bacterium]